MQWQIVADVQNFPATEPSTIQEARILAYERLGLKAAPDPNNYQILSGKSANAQGE